MSSAFDGRVVEEVLMEAVGLITARPGDCYPPRLSPDDITRLFDFVMGLPLSGDVLYRNADKILERQEPIWKDKRRGIRADRKELGLGRIPGRIRDLVMNNVRVRQCFDLALHNSWDYQRFLEVALAELCDHNQACFDKTVADAMSAAFPADPKALQAFYCPQTLPKPTMIERVRKTIMDAHARLLRDGNRDKIGVVLINYADAEQFRREIVASGQCFPDSHPSGVFCYFDGCEIRVASDHVAAPGRVAWLRASCMSPPDPQPGNFLLAAEEAVKRMTKEVIDFLNEPEIVPSVFDAINTVAAVDSQPKDCTCPTSVLLVSGCKCGGK